MAQDSAIRQGEVEGNEAEHARAGAAKADEAGAERTSVRASSSTNSASASTRAAPACSGQAYFIGDGQPRNPQAFLDGILDGLGAVVVE